MVKTKGTKKTEDHSSDDFMSCGKDDNCCYPHKHKHKVKCGSGGGGALYGIGVIGALVYFFQHLGPATFGNVIWVIIKSVFWPALIVYKALELLKF
jgi:hypothetical protein